GDVGDENDEADADVEIAENAAEETNTKEDADDTSQEERASADKKKQTDISDDVETLAAESHGEEAEKTADMATSRRARGFRRYKIQEVIKRRQILLVQVVKEERGNKGAALTTYISLAGRYCVLMPNSSRGGGISRKITGSNERRKLRDTLNSLDMPEGMGVIIRTAGLERSKAEIKRDFEYLIRAWDEVRETTLESTAPNMVYEEGDIIKRAIRDVYSKDIEEIQVEGLKTYQTAKRFMRLMMPSHAKRVQQYKDEIIPLFQRFQIEQQLDAMHNPEVQLKSGGYIVINPTEALVAIDVNSGKSTRERNIEETAAKTNIEAAEEVARQLRLRDLAGLIVIDFIDMEETRNIRKVEKRLKDAMKTDRARLQIGRISNFGLLELSRQRLRPSLQETSSQICPHCRGSGYILSTESMAMRVLRAIEEEGIRMRTSEITVRVPTGIALYILNQKRSTLVTLESRHGFQVILQGDDSVVPPDIEIDRVKGKPGSRSSSSARRPNAAQSSSDSGPALDPDTEAEIDVRDGNVQKSDKQKPNKRRRIRRRSQDPNTGANPDSTANSDSKGLDVEKSEEQAQDRKDTGEEKLGSRRRRRGRRGGRRRNRNVDSEEYNESAPDSVKRSTDIEHLQEQVKEDKLDALPSNSVTVQNEIGKDADEGSIALLNRQEANFDDTQSSSMSKTKPNGEPEKTKSSNSNDGDPEAGRPPSEARIEAASDESKPKRKGWWQKIVE
ncbi:MAG: ribonuclease E/G, partial [Pseudomonadota bacterium]|nr:ribonuclease E/G [Pseudomonadota bacterium]